MWKFLERIRTLPEKSKNTIVFFSSSFITAVLLVSWLVFPTTHFGISQNNEKGRKTTEELLTPFSVFSGEIGQTIASIKDKWSLAGAAEVLRNMQKMGTSTGTLADEESASSSSILNVDFASSTDDVATTTDLTSEATDTRNE